MAPHHEDHGIRATQSTSADEALLGAARLCAEGRIAEAATVLRAAIVDDPGALMIVHELALVEARRGNLAEAETLARRAVAAGGDAHAAGLGQVLAERGMASEAELWLHRALDANPADASAHAWLGALHAGSLRWTDALASFDRALALQPEFAWARVRRDLTEFLGRVQATYAAFAGARGLDPDPDARGLAEVEFPSSSRDTAGNSRFVMALPPALVVRDLGAAHLFQREIGGRGYEFALRRFLDRHLQPDDVFIDVGAHWGVHALTAATRWPGRVGVLAIEAHPENCRRLRGWVERNDQGLDVEVVGNAIGDRVGLAHMRVDRSSMGYQLSTSGDSAGHPTIEVAMTTLDRLLEERPHLRWRRIVLKIDVEGYELEVFAGARQLFASGDVAAVIWEKEAFHAHDAQEARDRKIFAFLNDHGFEHFRFVDEDGTGPLQPLSRPNATGNIYSLAPELARTAGAA